MCAAPAWMSWQREICEDVYKRQSQITVTCGGRQLARFKRQRMAPGAMEHIALPKVLLEKADGPLTVAVEAVIAE